MEPRSWVISLLSTAYDLSDHRSILISKLQNDGIKVSAFELSDFPTESGKHSHDSCLVALDRADIAIVIINKRSGGWYWNDKEHKETITEKEYLSAIEKGIPVLVFVHREAWEERHRYKQQFNEYVKSQTDSGLDLSELKKMFDQSYKKQYVDNIKTIDFIESIQHAYETHGASNWISTYSSVESLLNEVIGKLQGLSRSILSRISKNQKIALFNRHTSTAFGVSLGDVFNSKYYIEAPYRIDSGAMDSNCTSLSARINKAMIESHSVLVYGEAGYGKTTILAKCFSEQVDESIRNPSYCIPFFLNLKRKGSNYHFDFRKYIEEELANTVDDSLGRKPYPYLCLDQIRPLFYCDGFDELAEQMSTEELGAIAKTDIFSFTVLLTSRAQYAYRYINNYSFSDKFGIRVVMKTWDDDVAKEYISNFCSIKEIGENDKSALISSIFGNNNELRKLLDSPLLITMFLWFMERNRMHVPNTALTRAQLFKEWIYELAKRECTRFSAGDSAAAFLVKAWSVSAWEVYYSRIKNVNLSIHTLIQTLYDYFPSFRSSISPSLLGALFDCGSIYVYGTFHEQFLEYLVADCLVSACKDQKHPYPIFLQLVMRPEINRYFRAIWSECSNEEKGEIFKAIWQQYFEHIGDSSHSSVLIRVHAVYHIGRLDAPEREKYLQQAFSFESHISVKLSLYFGAIKMGKLDIEEEFYQLLVAKPEYDDANRGYHLAYYSDIIPGRQMPFSDDTTCKWDGTMNALVKHFESNERGHFFLRRVDLLTMRQLVATRKHTQPLTDEVMAQLERHIAESTFAQDYLEYNQKVIQEFATLKKVYNTYR